MEQVQMDREMDGMRYSSMVWKALAYPICEPCKEVIRRDVLQSLQHVGTLQSC